MMKAQVSISTGQQILYKLVVAHCHGVRLRFLDGHIGSQKPHSIHLSICSSTLFSSLMFLVRNFVSLVSLTSGFRIFCLSKIFLICYINISVFLTPLDYCKWRNIMSIIILLCFERTIIFFTTSAARAYAYN